MAEIVDTRKSKHKFRVVNPITAPILLAMSIVTIVNIDRSMQGAKANDYMTAAWLVVLILIAAYFFGEVCGYVFKAFFLKHLKVKA